jgi:hypothetical protein
LEKENKKVNEIPLQILFFSVCLRFLKIFGIYKQGASFI